MEAIVKSQTKGSPYYNIVFLERLKDITDRLTGSSQISVAGYDIYLMNTDAFFTTIRFELY